MIAYCLDKNKQNKWLFIIYINKNFILCFIKLKWQEPLRQKKVKWYIYIKLGFFYSMLAVFMYPLKLTTITRKRNLFFDHREHILHFFHHKLIVSFFTAYLYIILKIMASNLTIDKTKRKKYISRAKKNK